MCFNVGVIIGPILGGILADPAGSYPGIFGNVQWMKKFPYATPNIVSATFLFAATIGVFFGLDEVSNSPSIFDNHRLIHNRLSIQYAITKTLERNVVER
jgi:MFS family permease